MGAVKTEASSLPEYALDQAQEFVIMTDANLARPGGPRIVYVNQAMTKATGYTRSELIGQSPRIFQGAETDRDVASRIIERLSQGERVHETILNYTKDGSPYWAELNISAVYDDKGQICAYYSVQQDLTELRRVKEQYERDLRLISTAEKIARVGTWGYNIEEDTVIWSHGSYDIWEWDRDQAPPSVTNCIELFDEADRQMITARLEACIKTQTPYQVEVGAQSRMGTAMRLRVIGEAILGENGRTVAVVGAIRDVTEEKRFEQEMDNFVSRNSETERHFSVARSIAKIGVFDYWIEHDRLHWSEELHEMTGLSKDLFPAVAEVFLSRIDAKDQPEYLKLMQAAIDHHEGYAITVQFNRPGGKQMHMAIIAEVRESDYGPRIVGIARDVTAEVESVQRLSREQERFRIIADGVSDVLWDHDFEGENFWITSNWPERLGVDLDGTGSDPRQWLRYVVSDDREKVVLSITKALQSGANRWECDFTIEDPEGTKVEVEVKGSILRNTEGQAYRILGNCRNVTIEKRQRDGFTRSRALETVGQMTGGTAHDFNNLLMIIQGNAELLKLVKLDPEHAKSVDIIMQAADAAASLTSRLLSFSGQSKLSSTSVDLRQLIDDVTLLLRSALTESIELEIQVARNLWLIEVDGRALEQAIINLAVNARDAIGHDGGKIKLSCENATVTDSMFGGTPNLVPGRYVSISVSDNGAGMSEQVISKAFEPFFTTKEVGRGTGLGLSTVYGFVQQSGGTVQISSELGHGTTVSIYLPVKDACKLENVAADVDLDIPFKAGLRILVVEDQDEVRAYVERLLTRSGYIVISANDGKSALDLLEAGASFDLLFTDIIMPGGLNGVQLAEAVARIAPHTRVLFTSGFPASAFDELGISQLQEIELLKKPYKSAQLVAAVNRLLNYDINQGAGPKFI